MSKDKKGKQVRLDPDVSTLIVRSTKDSKRSIPAEVNWTLRQWFNLEKKTP